MTSSGSPLASSPAATAFSAFLGMFSMKGVDTGPGSTRERPMPKVASGGARDSQRPAHRQQVSLAWLYADQKLPAITMAGETHLAALNFRSRNAIQAARDRRLRQACSVRH